ncbi:MULTISPECIES: GNAT family N-acetyltransferase [Burkholderia]|uniref:GNAT family N-acetyltransferase n=1 Tax=Burkholderia TaxID=32008 RepID=UPI0008412F34|nr:MULTISPECIES: GNAT family protein [Burkholderia]AOJ19142.1 phosphinothricin acetyltransferase [Burkholderia cenocepacia]MBJ9728483.1 GNAT family N-acetyltransferase [Burkholderia cenocepacia]MBL3966395.1 GNAT family N-acetyltransferase [Burkholderia sp. KCJ3K979]MBR8037718.1 GNAT family N-acetyltransferase [Burkholderia cenocepacia]MBR8328299.1 GNAT family N-acetyltransferase [Burkholderia cenocepacia]
MNRILLKRVARSDAADLIAANRASRSHHLPWVDSFIDQAGFDQWFARCLTGPNVGFIARERASGAVVGVVNLNEIVGGVFQSAYLAYYGMAEFSRKGLMTDALRAAIDVAFGELGLHRLEANIQPGNHASIALVRRLGFRQEGFSPRYLRIGGEWRDHERWALLADDAREGGA